MSKVSKKSLNEELRAKYIKTVSDYLISLEEEVLVTGSNEIALPCVDSEGNDEFIVITFKIPTGSHEGDAYDGYSMAEDYKLKCKAKAEKAKVAAEKKRKKIEKDKKMREQKKLIQEKKKGAN